ncbi:MAG: endolytic transglycosylase MltG [Candidatus Zixiibacteriota bacterium]
MKRLWDWLFWLITTLAIFALIPLIPFVYLIRGIVLGKWYTRLAILFVVALAIASIYVYSQISTPLGDKTKEYSVIIRPKDDAADLRRRLADNGIITDRRLYNIFMKYTQADKRLKPGRYRFAGGITHYELARFFKNANPELSKVTLPEGKTVKVIVPILAREIPTDSARLVSLLGDASFRRSLNIEAPSFEGYLFPETYSFYPYQEPEDVIREMVEMFRSSFTPEMSNQLKALSMSLNEVVTLASMIEAEAADGSERELISSVFHNRLRKGWKMQCDPTVIYALGGLDRPLLRTDLDFDSPYNTYLYFGLPPGPICSPGLASLRAALFPADSDYYFFVATGDGRHVFTTSLSQHNTAVSRNKRLRRN